MNLQPAASSTTPLLSADLLPPRGASLLPTTPRSQSDVTLFASSYVQLKGHSPFQRAGGGGAGGAATGK